MIGVLLSAGEHGNAPRNVAEQLRDRQDTVSVGVGGAAQGLEHGVRESAVAELGGLLGFLPRLGRGEQEEAVAGGDLRGQLVAAPRALRRQRKGSRVTGVEHDDHRPYVAPHDPQHLVEVGHAQPLGQQVLRRGGVGEEVVAAAGQIADAVAGDEEHHDVVRARAAEETGQTVQHALARHLLVGQHLGVHVAILAPAGGRAQGLGEGARIGGGEVAAAASGPRSG